MNAPASARRLAAGLAALSVFSCLFDSRTAGTGSTTESGIVIGRVVSPDGKDPVAGATVALVPSNHIPSVSLRKVAAPPTTLSDKDGYYRFERVSAGVYNVLAAKDSLRAFRDSLAIGDSGAQIGNDTLGTAGSLSGIVRLQPGDDPRTVLILVIGTNTLTFPRDTSGAFTLQGMGAGDYTVRFLSTISEYSPLDTGLRIRPGASDTLPDPIRLPFRGIPGVENVEAEWDSLLQQVDLTWTPADTALVSSYNVYRAPLGTPFGSTPVNASPIRSASFADTGTALGATYSYVVKAVDKNGNVGARTSAPVFVTTTALYRLARTIVMPAVSTDQTPLAVSRGEIFWLNQNSVEVYDTTGMRRRIFGDSGAGALASGSILRVIRDTVYVVDFVGTPQNPDSRLKRFTRQGQYLDSLEMGGIFPLPGGGDIWKSPEGKLFATNGSKIYVFAPGGLDSMASPLTAPLLRGIQKLEPFGDRILLMNGMPPNATTGKTMVQFAFFRQTDLSVALFDSISTPKFSGFATDGTDRVWMNEGTRVTVNTEKMEAVQKIAVQDFPYIDIVLGEEENLYLAKRSASEILILRKP